MTLVVAWTRTTQTGRELWILSDSRLSGGKLWDYGPKIFGIGRSDAVIAFAGDTSWTYPLIAQISSYVESFVNLRDRVIDVAELFGRIVQMLNDSLSFVTDPAHPSMALPECSFVFAGYSVRRKDFFVRRIDFQPKRNQFVSTHPKSYGGESVAYVGDAKPVKATVRRMSEILKQRKAKRQRLDMTPAVAFFEVLSSGKFRDIGGAPQVTKVYEHMNLQHFGVYWPPNVPNEEQAIFLRGRRLKSYEVLDHPWVYDPTLTKFWWHDFSPDQRRDAAAAKAAALLTTQAIV
ncbi:hypothetical protein [Burkholderia ambifaria]|uniref:hypothetical protein n=1 Tax=Burkholderia ambifaria TaxID=152480 RepID=UPI001B95DE76|nr:hypothetical protein [Burkholderia ambifaria]MBR8184603.1 hypothetical protein [Burkholderia ambifaria]